MKGPGEGQPDTMALMMKPTGMTILPRGTPCGDHPGRRKIQGVLKNRSRIMFEGHRQPAANREFKHKNHFWFGHTHTMDTANGVICSMFGQALAGIGVPIACTSLLHEPLLTLICIGCFFFKELDPCRRHSSQGGEVIKTGDGSFFGTMTMPTTQTLAVVETRPCKVFVGPA